MAGDSGSQGLTAPKTAPQGDYFNTGLGQMTAPAQNALSAPVGNFAGAGGQSGANTEALLQSRQSPTIGGTGFMDKMFHGGGDTKLNSTELNRYAALSNAMEKETDPVVRAQFQEEMKTLANPDRGGYMGALGRIVTGKGTSGTENMATMLGGLGAQALKQYYMNSLAAGQTEKMLANQNKIQNQQQQNMMNRFNR